MTFDETKFEKAIHNHVDIVSKRVWNELCSDTGTQFDMASQINCSVLVLMEVIDRLTHFTKEYIHPDCTFDTTLEHLKLMKLKKDELLKEKNE